MGPGRPTGRALAAVAGLVALLPATPAWSLPDPGATGTPSPTTSANPTTSASRAVIGPQTPALTDVPLLNPTAGVAQCGPPGQIVYTATPWAQTRLAPQRVWPLTQGDGVTVAVVDSGVDPTVPQLAGRVDAGANLVAPPATGDADCVGHGTFVAGIIAAAAVPGVPFAGVAPHARILPLRQTVTGSDGSAGTLALAIRAAVRRGAKVVNVSLQAGNPSPDLESAVRDATRADVLIVAATGNDGANGNARPYPASLPGVVAVGAIDDKGAVPASSGTGDFVDLVAPGVDVVSLGQHGPGHLRGSGTSFAAPFVSGVAALVRARHPKLTTAQVKHRLEVTADHPPTRLPDPRFGFGVPNPVAAVTAVLPEEGSSAEPAPAPVTVVAARRGGGDPSGLPVALTVLGLAALLIAVGVWSRSVRVAVSGRDRLPADVPSRGATG